MNDPAELLLKDPLQEEARRNRRALLALSLLCSVAWFTDVVPQNISALGVSFSDTDARRLIWIAMILQFYFLLTFIVSAASDLMIWQNSVLREIEEYVGELGPDVFDVKSAVEAAVDELEGKWLRLRPPAHRRIHEFRHFADKKRGLYKMFFITSPVGLVHHLLVFAVPIVVFVASVTMLVTWNPHIQDKKFRPSEKPFIKKVGVSLSSKRLG